MLDVKKLLAKVTQALNTTPTWAYAGLVNQIHWSSWTCPEDGMVVADIGLTTNGGVWYYYVNDTTDNFAVGKISGTNANGTSRTVSFPVIKGHTYKQSAFQSVNGSALYFRYYQFNKLGGVVSRLLKALQSLTSERRWVFC